MNKIIEQLNEIDWENPKNAQIIKNTVHKVVNEKDKKISHLEHEILEREEDLGRTIDKNEKLKSENEKLKEENEKIKKQLAILTFKLNQNSSNSNWSSSRDKPWLKSRKHIYSSRAKSNLNVDGQAGHKGNFGSLCKNPDEIIEHINEIPLGNGYIDENNNRVIKQVKEIEFRTKIIQHNYNFNDGTKVINLPLLPNAHSYGQTINSFIIWMTNEGFISINRISHFLKELTNNELNVSESYVASLQIKYAQQITPIVNKICEEIKKSKVVHFDETCINVDGKQATIQGYADNKNTYLCASNKKCDETILDYFDDYDGWIVTDYCKFYQNLKMFCKLAQCNVHIERYLRSLDIDYKIPESKTMMSLLHQVKKHKEELLSKDVYKLSKDVYDDYYKRFIDICNSFLNRYEKMNDNDQYYCKDGHLLFSRLLKNVDQHLAFVKDFDAPFSNNTIERDFRNTKTKMKISGCFKSLDYATAFAQIRSFLQTCKKRNLNTWTCIQNSMSSSYQFC